MCGMSVGESGRNFRQLKRGDLKNEVVMEVKYKF